MRQISTFGSIGILYLGPYRHVISCYVLDLGIDIEGLTLRPHFMRILQYLWFHLYIPTLLSFFHLRPCGSMNYTLQLPNILGNFQDVPLCFVGLCLFGFSVQMEKHFAWAF